MAVASFATIAIISDGPIPDWKSNLEVPKLPLDKMTRPLVVRGII